MKSSRIISALMTLALGILFVILKQEIIGIAITVFGVALIITAVLDLFRKNITAGVIKGVLGVVVLVLGWALLDVALLILGIVLLIYGILELIRRIRIGKNGGKLWAVVLGLIEPVICIAASIFLITSRGEAITWTILIAGIFLIVDGILALISALGSKN